MSKKIPVVVYDAYGQRKEVGEAAVTQTGSHFFISAKVTDPEVAKLFEIDPKEFSISGKPMPRLWDQNVIDRNEYAYLQEIYDSSLQIKKED